MIKEEYGVHLEENLEMLERRIKNKSYKPKPARKVEIPKEDGKTRPLSIYCYEDKLVQEVLRRILEAVFEPHFYDEMMGLHQALGLLNIYIEKRYTGYVLDADIKSFFNNLDHEWAVKLIESKIKDPNIIRLARWMLKAGIMEGCQFSDTEAGTGQGSSVRQSSQIYTCTMCWCGGSRKRYSQRPRNFAGWWCMRMILWPASNTNGKRNGSTNR